MSKITDLFKGSNSDNEYNLAMETYNKLKITSGDEYKFNLFNVVRHCLLALLKNKKDGDALVLLTNAYILVSQHTNEKSQDFEEMILCAEILMQYLKKNNFSCKKESHNNGTILNNLINEALQKLKNTNKNLEIQRTEPLSSNRLQRALSDDTTVNRILFPDEQYPDFKEARADVIRQRTIRVIQQNRHKLAGTDLSNADLIGIDLNNTNLQNINLSGANLTGANLNDTNLTGANLSNANLTGANIKNAKLNVRPKQKLLEYGFTNLRGANLSHANLNNSELKGADLIRANLSNADLSNANLSMDFFKRVSDGFSDITTQKTRLDNANLTNANMPNANLTGANLKGASLKDTFLRNIIANNTIMPDGKKYNPEIHDTIYPSIREQKKI